MKLLFERDFRIGFLTGVALHILMVWTRVNFFPTRCIGEDCGGLLALDFPIMILYYAFDDSKIVFLSFVLGSALWGIWFWLILKLFRKFFDR